MIDWDAPSEPMSFKFTMESPRDLRILEANMWCEIYQSLDEDGVLEDGKSYILRWHLEEI